MKLLSIILTLILLFGCAEKEKKVGEKQDSDTSIQKTILSYTQRQGKQIYTKYCLVCHGEQGKGDGFNAYNLTPKPRNFSDTTLMQKSSDERLAMVIRDGGRNSNLSLAMPSWGGRLNDKEFEYVVSYLRTFR